jgi:ABC-type uncharacterized transport system involved in gliding motility auxiliary subunit
MGILVFFWLILGLILENGSGFFESIWLTLTADLAYIASSDPATLSEIPPFNHFKYPVLRKA